MEQSISIFREGHPEKFDNPYKSIYLISSIFYNISL